MMWTVVEEVPNPKKHGDNLLLQGDHGLSASGCMTVPGAAGETSLIAVRMLILETDVEDYPRHQRA